MMKKQILIDNLKETESYDRENALIDLYIFLISENESLTNNESTKMFIELSDWRDYSLRDGVESYYENKSEDELIELQKHMKNCLNKVISSKYIEGMNMYRQSKNLSEVDNWIYENEWNINDFLVELASCELRK